MLVLMLALSVPAFADPDEGGQQTETEAEKEDLSVVLKTQGSKAFLHYKATGKKVTGLTGIHSIHLLICVNIRSMDIARG